MTVWLAYVSFNDFGVHIIKLEPDPEQAKTVCADYFKARHDGLEVTFEWSEFHGHDGNGWQAPYQEMECYYVEAIDVDGVGNSLAISDNLRRLLQALVESGELAQRLIDRDAMIKPLEERIQVQEVMIDHLLEKLGLTEYTFPESVVGLPEGELWYRQENTDGTTNRSG